jgi:hypothetical protein
MNILSIPTVSPKLSIIFKLHSGIELVISQNKNFVITPIPLLIVISIKLLSSALSARQLLRTAGTSATHCLV